MLYSCVMGLVTRLRIWATSISRALKSLQTYLKPYIVLDFWGCIN